MKKIIIIAFLLISLIPASFSQDEISSGSGSSFISKNGHEVLPQKGEYSITVGANSLLYYLGSFFKSDEGYYDGYIDFFNHPNNMLADYVFGGKYMLTNQSAIRGAVSIYYSNSTNKARIDDDLSINPDDFLYDKRIYKRSGFLVSAGLEKRRGSSRVQGLYGIQASAGYIGDYTEKFEYANSFSTANQFPTSTSWGIYSNLPIPADGYRIKENKRDGSLSFGASVFAGVEYFIAPKISIGGEFSLGLSYNKNKVESLTFESYNPFDDSVVEYKLTSENDRSILMDIFNMGGLVNLNFYF